MNYGQVMVKNTVWNIGSSNNLMLDNMKSLLELMTAINCGIHISEVS